MLEAIAGASAIVIGPSNPVISIGPILALPGMRDALRAAPAPVVAVSPLVGGAVLKGPTADFMALRRAAARAPRDRRAYDGRASTGSLADEARASTACRVAVADTLMADADGRRRVRRGARSELRGGHR